MIELGGQRILIGGFHDHWARADMENPALFLAALNYYHYDFITLQDGPQYLPYIAAAAKAFSDRIRIYPGREECYAWGHVVTAGPRAAPPPSDDPDPYRVLSKLQKTCELVILAHPNYPTTWKQLFLTGEMDRLMDAGVIDGINLINTDGFDQEQHRELLEWFRARDAAGKRTPIVGGWDLHLIVSAKNLPPVLYSAQRSPRGHYESPLGTRTLVFADENELTAICDAVKAGKTVIEDLATGELAGPAALLEFLKNNGYRDALARMDARRDAVRLSVPGKCVAGSAAELRVSCSGKLSVPFSLAEAERFDVNANAAHNLKCVPAVLQRDNFYIPVSWHGADGAERIWAVETTHPIQFDVLPWLGDGGPAVELTPRLPFQGTITLEVDGLLSKLERKIAGRTLIPVSPAALQTLSFNYRFEACNTAGVRRTQTGYLNFIGVRQFAGDWEKIPEYGIDKQEFVPRSSYGVNRPWPGPQEFSGRIQFAWTRAEFMMRIAVRDAIHFQPFEGHFAYNGDCLQLAIDPMLRRRETIGNVYSFNLSLTKKGPELYRFLTPTDEATDRFTPPSGDVSLNGQFLEIEKRNEGLVYLLRLPWQELGPLVPALGARIGVYFIMFNNNGSGHLDTLHWPVPIDGMWMLPAKWGIISLV